jgi:hypothetical protein
MLAGSVGLLLWGPAVVRIFDVLVWDPGQPVSPGVQQMGLAAASALVFSIGAALVHMARAPGRSRVRVRALVGGPAAMVAGGLMLWSVLRAREGFIAIAGSPTRPNSEDLQHAMAGAATLVTLAFAVMLVLPLLTLMLALLPRGPAAGAPGSPRDDRVAPANGQPALPAGLPLLGVLVAAAAFAAMFALCWFRSRDLAGLLQAGSALRPNDLASPLTAILDASLAAGGALLLFGVSWTSTVATLRRASGS